MNNTITTNMVNEKGFSEKLFKTTNKQNKNKNEETKKKEKLSNKFGLKKMSLKEKKNKTNGIFKNNLNNNYIATSKLNQEKNKNYLTKTNKNFRKSKYIFNSTNLNERNNQIIKNKKTTLKKPYEKSNTTLSHTRLFRSQNSELTKLMISQKKEDPFLYESNTSTKIFHKGKIKNMKFKKDNLLFNTLTQSTNLNSSFNNNLNNFYNENFGNKIILTNNNDNENNGNNNKNINNNNSKAKTNNSLFRTHNLTSSELRNKYKNFYLKKNKQKSCEIENQSVMQRQANKELLKRMNLIKQKNKYNFYQKYKDNKVKLGDIKRYNGTNIGSFDNLSNSNSINSFGNAKNYVRNSAQVDNHIFQTPSTENKKLGLYKKVIRQKTSIINTEKKKLEDKKGNFDTPSAIKVNTSKFLKRFKDKFYDNNKIFTMTNYNSRFSHKNL